VSKKTSQTENLGQTQSTKTLTQEKLGPFAKTEHDQVVPHIENQILTKLHQTFENNHSFI